MVLKGDLKEILNTCNKRYEIVYKRNFQLSTQLHTSRNRVVLGSMYNQRLVRAPSPSQSQKGDSDSKPKPGLQVL